MHYAITFVGTLFVLLGAGFNKEVSLLSAILACFFILFMLRFEAWLAKRGS